MLDEVAWLFNLRGSDIEFNPVFFAYAIITQEKAILFVNGNQIDDTVKAHLGHEVQIKGYDEFFGHLKGLGAELGLSKESVCIRYEPSEPGFLIRGFVASVVRRQS